MEDAQRKRAKDAFVKYWRDTLETHVDNLSGCDPKALAYDAAWKAFRAGRESVSNGR